MNATPSFSNAQIAHIDVAGENIDALSAFYQNVLGWTVDLKGPGYGLLQTPHGGPNGALVEMPNPSLTLGIAVEDLDRAVALAKENGGEVVMPATDNGWVTKAQIHDCAGNLLTLIQI